MDLFEFWDGCGVVVVVERLFLTFVSGDPLLKEQIIEKANAAEMLVQQYLLLLCRVQPVFVRI